MHVIILPNRLFTINRDHFPTKFHHDDWQSRPPGSQKIKLKKEEKLDPENMAARNHVATIHPPQIHHEKTTQKTHGPPRPP